MASGAEEDDLVGAANTARCLVEVVIVKLHTFVGKTGGELFVVYHDRIAALPIALRNIPCIAGAALAMSSCRSVEWMVNSPFPFRKR